MIIANTVGYIEQDIILWKKTQKHRNVEEQECYYYHLAISPHHVSILQYHLAILLYASHVHSSRVFEVGNESGTLLMEMHR